MFIYGSTFAKQIMVSIISDRKLVEEQTRQWEKKSVAYKD